MLYFSIMKKGLIEYWQGKEKSKRDNVILTVKGALNRAITERAKDKLIQQLNNNALMF